MGGEHDARDIGADIDLLLDTLLAEWRDVAELAEEPTSLDPADQELYQLEWTLAEERLKHLRGYAQAALLTPAQQRRYNELEQLIAHYRPTLETLFEDRRVAP